MLNATAARQTVLNVSRLQPILNIIILSKINVRNKIFENLQEN